MAASMVLPFLRGSTVFLGISYHAVPLAGTTLRMRACARWVTPQSCRTIAAVDQGALAAEAGARATGGHGAGGGQGAIRRPVEHQHGVTAGRVGFGLHGAGTEARVTLDSATPAFSLPRHS